MFVARISTLLLADGPVPLPRPTTLPGFSVERGDALAGVDVPRLLAAVVSATPAGLAFALGGVGATLTGRWTGPSLPGPAFDAALSAALSEGRFQRLTVSDPAGALLTVDLAPGGATLSASGQTIVLQGVVAAAAADLASLAGALPALVDALAGRAPAGPVLDLLAGLGLTVLRLTDAAGGTATLTLGAGSSSLQTDGYLVEGGGGPMGAAALLHALAAVASQPFSPADLLAELARGGVAVTGPGAVTLLSAQAQAGGPAEVHVEGTNLGESLLNMLARMVGPGSGAVALHIDLGAGDDSVTEWAADMARRAGQVSLTVDGGSGHDRFELDLSERSMAALGLSGPTDITVDLAAGWLRGVGQADGVQRFDCGLSGVEEVRVATSGLVRMAGSTGDDVLSLARMPMRLLADGAGGTDRLDLSDMAWTGPGGGLRHGLTLADLRQLFQILRQTGSDGQDVLVLQRDGAEWGRLTRVEGILLLSDDRRGIVEVGMDALGAVRAVTGGPGDDQTLGSAMADLIDGGAGNDRILANAGADTLVGGAGNDLLIAEPRNTVLEDVAGQVYRLYRATLGREPDPTGLAGWTGTLMSGERDLPAVVDGFLGSVEFRRTYGNTDNLAFVTLLYANVLGRAPDPGGLAAWLGQLEDGLLTRARVVVGFANSREFVGQTQAEALALSRAAQAAGWTDDVFRLYRATLDRAPDAPGLAGWAIQLGEGRSLLSVVEGFVNSAEFRARYGLTDDRQFVTLLYANVLDRAPDPAGLSSWLARIEAGMSRAQVVQGFSQSAEFRARTAPDVLAYMMRQPGDDRLEGGAGDDVMFGGLWSDRFVFRAGQGGSDRIVGLEPWDRVELHGFGLTAQQVLSALRASGGDTVLSLPDQTIRFLDIAPSAFDAAMFDLI